MSEPDHDAIIQSSSKNEPLGLDEALAYVDKVKARFTNEPETYKAFLKILETFHKQKKDITEIYAQVAGLLKSAPDLLEEFDRFMPESAARVKANGTGDAGGKGGEGR